MTEIIKTLDETSDEKFMRLVLCADNSVRLIVREKNSVFSIRVPDHVTSCQKAWEYVDFNSTRVS